ncbi:MAG: hypothetical protein G01um101413_809 [Parcubacteria group bacterium Gr01-1014_13]|nr:MAG: hypothetical protein G01um101413_809 [Parcubacteria group bacterium Gr01-1014_13]
MKKSSIVAVVSLVILILAGLGLWYYQNSKSDTSTTPTSTTKSTTSTPTPTPTTSSQGLVVNTPIANTVVTSPLVISGYVGGGDKWIGFEGQVGTVKLLDANNNILADGILVATTNWMQLPVSFAVTLTFSTPTTATGTLVFKNENPSGEPSNDRQFTLPIKF